MIAPWGGIVGRKVASEGRMRAQNRQQLWTDALPVDKLRGGRAGQREWFETQQRHPRERARLCPPVNEIAGCNAVLMALDRSARLIDSHQARGIGIGKRPQ